LEAGNSSTYTGNATAILKIGDGRRNKAPSHYADNNHGMVDVQGGGYGAEQIVPVQDAASSSNGTPRLEDETRPFNAGVTYCIKY
jgi:hypothetical protein